MKLRVSKEFPNTFEWLASSHLSNKVAYTLLKSIVCIISPFLSKFFKSTQSLYSPGFLRFFQIIKRLFAAP